MPKNDNAKYVRDRVTGYAKNVSRATEENYGINRILIVRAVMGDENAQKQISDMGRTGERLKLAMPLIRQNLINSIEGNTEYNTSMAEILKAGSKGSSQVIKAGSDLTLEDVKYQNLIKEYEVRLFSGLKAENQRHEDSLDVIELQAWIDSQMATVNHQAQMETITNKPLIAQMKEDRAYEDKKTQHLLEYGSDADLSLIPRKNFETNPVVKAWNSVRRIFT
jgi:hypothetical protein